MLNDCPLVMIEHVELLKICSGPVVEWYASVISAKEEVRVNDSKLGIPYKIRMSFRIWIIGSNFFFDKHNLI